MKRAVSLDELRLRDVSVSTEPLRLSSETYIIQNIKLGH